MNPSKGSLCLTACVVRLGSGTYTMVYRFERPANKDFPPKIELLSRRPDALEGIDTALGRFSTMDDNYSLSAILLDDDYYQLLGDGTEIIDGLPVLGLRYLPVFKMHAWANLMRDRASGRTVHSDEIKCPPILIYCIRDPCLGAGLHGYLTLSGYHSAIFSSGIAKCW